MSPIDVAGAPRRAVPAPHRQAPRPRRAPPDAAGDGRVVLPAPRRRRTGGVRSSRRVRRHASTRPPRSRSRAATTSTGGSDRCAREPGREVDGRARDRSRRHDPLHDARDPAPVRAGATRRVRRHRPVPPRPRPALTPRRSRRGPWRRGSDDAAWLRAGPGRPRQHSRRGRMGARLRRPRRPRARAVDPRLPRLDRRQSCSDLGFDALAAQACRLPRRSAPELRTPVLTPRSVPVLAPRRPRPGAPPRRARPRPRRSSRRSSTLSRRTPAR